MRQVVRHSLAISTAAIALLPLGLAQASGPSAHAAMSLRYHFTSGERYAYHMRLNMQLGASGAGVDAAAGNTAVTLVGTVSYHVRRVDAAGGAYADTSAHDMSMTVTTNGRTTTAAVPAPAPSQVYLGADGSQRGATSGGFSAYGSPALGSLPSGRVAPGAHWSSTAYASLPSTIGAAFTPMRLTAVNRFDHYGVARYPMLKAERAAVIDSTGAIEYVTDTAIDGVPAHMHLSGNLSAQSYVGIAARRQLSAKMHMDMRMFMTANGASASGQAVREHVVLTLTMDPAAA